jgi:hypothetical protein
MQLHGMLCPSLLPDRFLELTNTWQIDCHFVRFDAARCAFDEFPIFIGKSRF